MRLRLNRSTAIATALALSVYAQMPGTPLGLSPALAQTPERNALNRRSPLDRKVEAERLHREAMGEFEEEGYTAALEKFQKSLALYKEIGDSSAIGRSLNNIGMVYSRLNLNDVALEFLEQALAINTEIGNTNGEWRTLFNMGQVYENIGQNNKAWQLYRQVLAIAQTSGDRVAALDKISGETGFAAELSELSILQHDELIG